MYSVWMQGMGGGRLRARWTLVESQDELSIDPRGLVVVVVVALDDVVVVIDVLVARCCFNIVVVFVRYLLKSGI